MARLKLNVQESRAFLCPSNKELEYIIRNTLIIGKVHVKYVRITLESNIVKLHDKI